MNSYDLCVCIRVHNYRDLVLDTIDSVLHNTDNRITKLIVAVDANKVLAKDLNRTLPDSVYLSKTRWGWGAGLYGLLAESINWSRKRWSYSHFMSIDYDTLFINKGVDELLLNQVTDPSVGLMGEYCARNIHWKAAFDRDKGRIRQKLGEIPQAYRPGEGVQGGCLFLCNSLIEQLEKRKMLQPPFSNAREVTGIADDHLITLFCRMCELEIAQVERGIHVRWQLDCNPIGLEKKDIFLFHPTKIRPGAPKRKIELQVRNYYRALRGREPLA